MQSFGRRRLRGGIRLSRESTLCGWCWRCAPSWAPRSAPSRGSRVSLGCGVETVRKWVAQAEIDAGTRAGVSTAESAELKRLRQENRELRRANEFLQRAAVFFGAELDRRQR